MKGVGLAVLALFAALLHATAILAAPGDLDATFGSGGRTIGPSGDVATALVVQDDGALVTLGNQFSLTRYTAGGVLDTTFASGGTATYTSEAFPFLWGAAVALQHGRFVIAGGWTYPLTLSGTAVARLLADGSPDGAFGSNALAWDDLASGPSGFDSLSAVVVRAGGGIVAGGTVAVPYDGDFALEALTDQGLPDASFGTGGHVFTDFGGNDGLAALVELDSGRLVAMGSSNQALALARYLPDGNLDGSFGTGGIVTAAFDAPFSPARGLVGLADGRVIVAGTIGDGVSTADPVVLRYQADGQIDPTFGAAGRAHLPTKGIASAHNVTTQTDGKIVVAGTLRRRGQEQLFVARLEPGGTVDLSFGPAGVVTTDFPGTRVVASAVVALDGALVVSGTASISDGIGAPVLARYRAAEPGACTPAPLSECRQAKTRRSQLTVRGGAPALQHLAWTWEASDTTPSSDFGDPLHATDYVLCVYDAALPQGRLALQARAPSGGACPGRACWTSTPTMFQYHDALATPDGMRSLTLTSGSTRPAKITAVTSGAHLSPPPLPASLPVHVQLQRSTSDCWEAVFSQSGVRKATTTVFSGRSD